MELSKQSKIEKQLEINGKKLVKEYPVLEDLAQFMSHPLSRDFYEKYMKNSESLNQMLDLLFFYEKIDKSDYMDLNAYQKIALLMEIIVRKDSNSTLAIENTK